MESALKSIGLAQDRSGQPGRDVGHPNSHKLKARNRELREVVRGRQKEKKKGTKDRKKKKERKKTKRKA